MAKSSGGPDGVSKDVGPAVHDLAGAQLMHTGQRVSVRMKMRRAQQYIAHLKMEVVLHVEDAGYDGRRCTAYHETFRYCEVMLLIALKEDML